MFEHIAADLALTASGVAGEKGRAIHDDGDPRAAVLRLLRVLQHVEQEKELSVADARKSWREASLRAAVVFGADRLLIALPVFAVRRIGDEVVERTAGVFVV